MYKKIATYGLSSRCTNEKDQLCKKMHSCSSIVFIWSQLDGAPIKTFKVRENHKFGISENTKKLIKERDHVRANLSKLEPREKAIQHIKYKKLRNRINSLVKSDTIKYNNTRVEQAKDENELWKIVKEITKPKEENKWSLKEEIEIITDEADIAEIFNTFFIIIIIIGLLVSQ